MTMFENSMLATLMMACTALALGCEQPEAAPEPTAATRQHAAPAAAKAAKIVFVDKQEACDCTRKKIDASRAALDKAVGTPAKLPVEQLHMDTEEAKVAPYETQRPILTLPAIYFVDGNDKVLDLLQGEVSEAQITAALQR